MPKQVSTSQAKCDNCGAFKTYLRVLISDADNQEPEKTVNLYSYRSRDESGDTSRGVHVDYDCMGCHNLWWCAQAYMP